MNRRRLGRIALAVIGVGVLVWVLSTQPLQEIATACARLGPLLLVTPLLGLAWFACNAAALYVLLARRVPWRALMWNRLVGEGFNALVPAAGFAGEPFKARHLASWLPIDEAISGLVSDRLTENATGLVVSAACMAAAPPLPESLRLVAIAWSIGAAIAGLAAALVVTSHVPNRIGGRIARWLGEPAAASVTVPMGRFIAAVVAYLAGRVFGMLEVAVLLWLLGVPVSATDVLFIAGALTAVGFLGFAVPQGIGITEAGTVFAVGLLAGVPGASVIAFALARRGRMLALSVLGVALRAVPRLASLPSSAG